MSHPTNNFGKSTPNKTSTPDPWVIGSSAKKRRTSEDLTSSLSASKNNSNEKQISHSKRKLRSSQMTSSAKLQTANEQGSQTNILKYFGEDPLLTPEIPQHQPKGSKIPRINWDFDPQFDSSKSKGVKNLKISNI